MVRARRSASAAVDNSTKCFFDNEKFYRFVVANAVDGFYVIDRQRRFVDVNESLCRMFGYAHDEMVSKTPADFIASESRGEMMRQMDRIEFTDSRHYRLTGLRKDGSTFPISLNAVTYRDAAGTVVGAFGFVADLTSNVEAEQAVAASERELQRMLDHMQDTYYRTDAAGRVMLGSQSVQSLLGYSPDELRGRPLADLYFLPSDRDDFLQRMAASNGAIKGYQSRLRHKDGHEVWVLTNAQYLHDASGAITGIEGTTRDNTEQRRAEESLRLAANVFENSGEAIMIMDADTHVVSVNWAFTQMTGYRQDEVLGRTPAILTSDLHDGEFYRHLWRTLRETGYWQGEIWNRRKSGEVFPEWLGISTLRGTTGEVTHYVAISSDISERKASEARIEFLAHHDPLTDLPNRLLLKDRLERAIVHGERTETKVALLFVDLDRFKTVNDSLGHPVGDRLLREAAQRLRQSIRDMDTVSRQGGDEFLVVLTELRDGDAITRVAEDILSALAVPFFLDGHDVAISCSIGVAVFPEDGSDFDGLQKKADIAMYHAKEAGRNTFRYYTERMNIDAMERLDLQNRLRRGSELGEFVLYYQPIIELASNAIVGAEALVRWNSDDFGLVAPGRFISVAEESGLIVQLGEWVLSEACRELRRWHDAGHTQLSMAVNLSAIQFRRGSVEESVMRALEAAGADPAALELELTESILLQGAEHVLASVRRLKSLGVRLSLDDFGTGYSSLAYLKRFAIDKLKIDQSFVRDLPTDPDNAAIVRAVIQMAKSLNLRVLAEGVESDAAAENLRLLECDFVQGFHFGRPMPAEEFRALIEQQKR